MNERAAEQECIQLSLPLNAAYVLTARLTASSVANRMGFETDEIEDIKGAVSEACAYIIRTLPAKASGRFHIQFSMEGNAMAVHIQTEGQLPYKEDEMSLIMIKALMDTVVINEESDGTAINMIKNHKTNIF